MTDHIGDANKMVTLERCARAAYDDRYPDKDVNPEWEALPDNVRWSWVGNIRAAFEEAMELDEAMLEAASRAICQVECGRTDCPAACDRWERWLGNALAGCEASLRAVLGGEQR